MTRSCVWHDSFACVTWLVDMCDITHCWCMRRYHSTYLQWHDSILCVTCIIRMCDMTRLHVWHDSFTCVTWLIYMCDMTHLHVWHDSFTCVTWLIPPYPITSVCSLSGTRFQEIILLIIQYKQSNIVRRIRCSKIWSPAQHYEVLIYYSTWLSRSFPPDQNGQAEMICTN